jgi:hypothetical protein
MMLQVPEKEVIFDGMSDFQLINKDCYTEFVKCFSAVRLDLASGLFPSGLPTKTL